MPQLDRFIATIFSHAEGRFEVRGGQEPCLWAGDTRRVLVTRKLDAAQVRFLVDEILDDSARSRLESIGGLDGFYVLPSGARASISIRSWKTDHPEAVFRQAAASERPAAPERPSPPAVPERGASPDAAPAREKPFSVPPRTLSPSVPRLPARVEAMLKDLAEPARPVKAEKPVSLNALLVQLVSSKGSDLHLPAGQPAMMRVDGGMVRLPRVATLEAEELLALVNPITPERNRDQFAADSDTDFAYEIPSVARFRVNLYRDRLGPVLVARVIPSKIVSADELGLPEAVRALRKLTKGLVLVTGPTGSGKSTTLAALVDLVNSERDDHIITLEDPIEFVHPSKRCMVNQREVGVHTNDFKRALRAALREDPDVLLVGEMRDLETVAIAIETAETGHLVFGTLHTTTAASTVDRIIDQFPADRQAQIRVMLSESLRAVIAQTLCKKIGGGRVAAYEVLLSTPAVANLIREGKTQQLASVMQTSRKIGMVPLNEALLSLVREGKITANEAYLRAVDKAALVNELSAAGYALDS